MALFEFDLRRVEDIQPWGEPGKQSLSWFALTDGFFRMVVGDQILFRYTEEILAHWGVGNGTPDADYQIAAFARDMLGSVAAGTTSLPTFVELIAKEWELLTRLQDQSSDPEDSEDMRYTAWRWLGERSPWTSYLVKEPRPSFVRIGDEVHIHWDNRDRFIEGISVWTAQYGVYKLPVEAFLAECRGFSDRLLAQMADRISQIEAGTAVPQIVVDVESLRSQQETWRKEFDAYFKTYEPDIAWDDAEAAIRAIAKKLGIELFW